MTVRKIGDVTYAYRESGGKNVVTVEKMVIN